MAREARRLSHYVVCRHCGRRYRSISVFHLRRVHDYEGEHPILDYKAEFGLRFAMCGEMRKSRSEAMECYWEERGQHWTPADVVSEIQRLHGGGNRLRRHCVPVSLYEVGRRLFGTWRAAVEAAGFDYEEVSGVRRWDRERIIERIRKLAADGSPLHATYVQEHYPFLHEAAVKRFPKSWARALRAAGFDPEEHKKSRGSWDRASAETWVREQAANGKGLLARDAPCDLRTFIYRHLGVSWPDFLESLEVAYPGIKKRRDWTKRTLLEAIRVRHAEGSRMNYAAVQSEYQALIKQARKFYGSWDRALAAAGI